MINYRMLFSIPSSSSFLFSSTELHSSCHIFLLLFVFVVVVLLECRHKLHLWTSLQVAQGYRSMPYEWILSLTHTHVVVYVHKHTHTHTHCLRLRSLGFFSSSLSSLSFFLLELMSLLICIRDREMQRIIARLIRCFCLLMLKYIVYV